MPLGEEMKCLRAHLKDVQSVISLLDIAQSAWATEHSNISMLTLTQNSAT